MPDAVNITFADEASFGGLTGSWLLVVICGIIVMFQTFKLIMEMAERYFILAVLTITSPLAFGMGGSRNTSDIFNGWCRMFGSMCLLMATNVMFVKMLLSVLSYYPSGLDVLPWMVLVITIVKVAKKADSILARIGLNPAMTGDPLGRGFPGAMTMMVVRSLLSNAAHTIGRNGNQPRSGSGNSSRMHRPDRALAVLAALPMSMRPRTQTAIIIARLRSKTARILHSIKNLFRLRRLLHRRIPYSPPPKRWRAHSLKPRLPEMASSLTPRGKQLCRPAQDVRRVMWRRQRTMQHPRQEKQRPMRRIIVRILRSPPWAARSHRIRSRSRPHILSRNPIRAAAQQCRIAAGLFCPARQEKRQAKIRRAVPISRPAVQESRITAAAHRGRRYRPNPHSSAAPFVQPPDTQRSAPNTAAPNAAPNNPASPSATPRSPAQPVGGAGKGQMQSAHTETTQQRNTFVQTPNMTGAQPAAEHPASPTSPRSGMAGNPSAPHIGVQPTSAPNGTAGKQPVSHSADVSRSALIRDTAGTGARPQQPGSPQNTPAPGTAGTQRTSIGGRYTQPVQQTTRVSANGTTQITQQNHVSAQQSSGAAQPTSGTRMDGRSTTREHPAPAAPSSNREVGMPPRSTTRPDAARPAEQRASQRQSLRRTAAQKSRYPRQRHSPTAKLVHPRTRPRGRMRRVQRSSVLRSAHSPHRTAAQKSRRRRLSHTLPLVFFPTDSAENRQLRFQRAA